MRPFDMMTRQAEKPNLRISMKLDIKNQIKFADNFTPVLLNMVNMSTYSAYSFPPLLEFILCLSCGVICKRCNILNWVSLVLLHMVISLATHHFSNHVYSYIVKLKSAFHLH